MHPRPVQHHLLAPYIVSQALVAVYFYCNPENYDLRFKIKHCLQRKHSLLPNIFAVSKCKAYDLTSQTQSILFALNISKWCREEEECSSKLFIWLQNVMRGNMDRGDCIEVSPVGGESLRDKKPHEAWEAREWIWEWEWEMKGMNPSPKITKARLALSAIYL